MTLRREVQRSLVLIVLFVRLIVVYFIKLSLCDRRSFNRYYPSKEVCLYLQPGTNWLMGLVRKIAAKALLPNCTQCFSTVSKISKKVVSPSMSIIMKDIYFTVNFEECWSYTVWALLGETEHTRLVSIQSFLLNYPCPGLEFKTVTAAENWVWRHLSIHFELL
jgi:hypothetical protein